MTTREIVDQLFVAENAYRARDRKVEELIGKVGDAVQNPGVRLGIERAFDSLHRVERWALALTEQRPGFVGNHLADFRSAHRDVARWAYGVAIDVPEVVARYEQDLVSMRASIPRDADQLLGLDQSTSGWTVAEEIELLVDDLSQRNRPAAERVAEHLDNAKTLARRMAVIHRGTFDVAVALREGRAPNFDFLPRARR